MKDMIFLPGNVPSLKNSKVKTSRGIFSSPTVTRYLRTLNIQGFNSRKKTVKGYVDPNRPNLFKKIVEVRFADMKKGKRDPIFIGYHQVRNSKRKFDFSNSVELIQDLLTSHDFIVDDNIAYVFPVPMTIKGELPTSSNIKTEEFYSVDKDNPGVWLKIF